MSQTNSASGYSGAGGLVYAPKVLAKIQHNYYCNSPMGKIANLQGDAGMREALTQGSKVYFHNSQGLIEDENCGDDNGNAALLQQSFSTDYFELCGRDKYTIKRSKEWLARNKLNASELNASLAIELMERQNRLTVPFFMMKLLGSADPSGVGLSAGGIPATAGVAAGLGDLNNPILIDVSSSRKGGNKLQTGTIDMPTLIGRLRGNMHFKGVTCSTSKLVLSGGTGLEQSFAQDMMCANDGCTLLGTGMQYDLNNWMPNAVGSAGEVSYVALHDPEFFWAGLYTLYASTEDKVHDVLTGAMTLWGAKVSRPKSVSVAVVKYV